MLTESIYFTAMREKGLADAKDLQGRASGLTGTELYAETDKIPAFKSAVALKNMSTRSAGFVCRSTDPAKALPFVALSTSPYGIGDCCTYSGKTYRSKIANNVHAPDAYPAGWEEVQN